MQRLAFVIFSFMAAALVSSSLFLITGCSPKPPVKAPPKNTPEDGPSAKPKVALKAGKGTITGRIVYDGDAPKGKMGDHTQKPDAKDPTKFPCKAPDGDIQNCQADSWKVGSDKGVADVLVYIKAPKD